MSFAELGYRAKGSLLTQLQQHGYDTPHKIPEPEISLIRSSYAQEALNVNCDIYLSAAERVMSGKMDVFSLEDCFLGKPVCWNRDPLTGITAPLSFGKKLNFKDKSVVGDIKYLWEPNRHLQLTVLAQAYYLSGDERFLDGIKIQLDSWLEQCPYLMGPNWSSSLEAGIRLINWSYVWRWIGGVNSKLFEDEEGAEFLSRWLGSIYQHAHFIQGHFSRYSSANNHLVGEAAGLFIATITWPCWNDFEHWRDKSKQILSDEAEIQNGSDGVNLEQAISYQQFVLDFLLITAISGRENGIEFDSAYWAKIEKMLEYLASLMDAKGHVPMIGDADDGYVVRLSREHGFCTYRSLLATGSVLFQRPDFKLKAGALDDKTRWLLGEGSSQIFNQLNSAKASNSLPVRRAFPEGGYYILGSNFEEENEVRLNVDAGPLGYQSIAAHGHADALAFTLNVAGEELLIDPGTYSYHAERKWRDYFRGTSAHNTVRVDYQDQSVIGGPFLWTDRANVNCENWIIHDDKDFFSGAHDGYTRLSDPVEHRRQITFDKLTNDIVVTDFLECNGVHSVERFWHFAEHCKVILCSEGVQVIGKRVNLHFTFNGDKNLEIELHHGNVDMPCGWVSRRYDVKVPTTTLVVSSRISSSTTLMTNIDIEIEK